MNGFDLLFVGGFGAAALLCVALWTIGLASVLEWIAIRLWRTASRLRLSHAEAAHRHTQEWRVTTMDLPGRVSADEKRKRFSV